MGHGPLRWRRALRRILTLLERAPLAELGVDFVVRGRPPGKRKQNA